MNTTAQQLPGLKDAYRAFDHGLRVRQAIAAYLILLFLVPSAITLDYFVYPELLWPIFKARMWCEAAMLCGLLLLLSPFGRKHVRILDKLCVAPPVFAICWMIYASEGAISPYYAGLTSTMVGISLILPYSPRESMWFCVFIICSYAAACTLNHLNDASQIVHSRIDVTGSAFYNNLYFIALSSTICIAACHFSSRRRFEDFCLRHDLDVNNRELVSTLKKLKDTEVQLVQSEKMNALGKLSAGLLHEVNNPLNFTFMALQIAEQEAEGNESLADTLKDIGQGMTRIRGVISDLRAFAYPSLTTERVPFNLDDALTTAMRLTAHELGDVSIDRTKLGPGKALGAKTQIVHVFMNLLVNAVQAIRTAKLDRVPKITVSSCENNGRLCVTVRDNGIGVKAANLPRLLEPFFTTKDVGQGMGLGLSICHTIVQNHGGGIKIASEEGQWTEVTFDLPLEESAPQPEPGDSTPAFTEEILEPAGSTA